MAEAYVVTITGKGLELQERVAALQKDLDAFACVLTKAKHNRKLTGLAPAAALLPSAAAREALAAEVLQRPRRQPGQHVV